MPGWIEVAKGDCENCHGTGVDPYYKDRIEWDGLSSARRDYPCDYCNGEGTKSIGYMDLRDASGR